MAAQREWFEKDYYKTLGVKKSDDAKAITKAYRKLARDLHPDANPGDAAAEERFKEVSAAYDVLGDDKKRAEYDEVRRLGPMAGGFGGGAGGPGAGFPGGGFGTDDLSDLLGGLFGRGRGGGGGQRSRPAKGADLETDLHLSFTDAVRGVTTAVHLTSDAPCSRCDGNGAEPGTSPTSCSSCGGRGVTDDNQGPFSFSQPCQRCAGRGVTISDPCTTCRGTGAERRPREVKVRIPAGVKPGQKIRLKGRGGPGGPGGRNGDLFVNVHVAAHQLFGRSRRNLTLKVPVAFHEAALGADIKVPTLDEGPVTLRLAPGTTNGRTLRVKGKGVGDPDNRGDLLVTVDVVVPEELTDDQRNAVEALAAASDTSPREHLGV
jgi:molecular chaperone DnaJ